MNRRDAVLTSLSALTSAMLGSVAAAAPSVYPDRPIRLIVPFAPGGVVDAVARLWTDAMSRALGTIITENRGGAGGTIGAAEVASSAPDGYTMLLGNTSTQLLDPILISDLHYHPAKDFTPVSILANSAIAIAVNPSIPVTNLKELIAYIKARPDKLSYGSPGTGTLTFLAAETFKNLAGTPNLLHVPYKGGGQSMVDLIGGYVPILAINITPQVLNLHKSGKIRIIAIFNQMRLAFLPDVQAASETFPELVVSLFTGIFVPASTSEAIISRVAQAQQTLAKSEEFKSNLENAGFEPVLNTPAEARRFMEIESGRIESLVARSGYRPQ